MKKLKRFGHDYVLAQVYKSGQKDWGKVSRRGRKPQGWNLYRKDNDSGSWLFLVFISNKTNCYMPLLRVCVGPVDTGLVGEAYV